MSYSTASGALKVWSACVTADTPDTGVKQRSDREQPGKQSVDFPISYTKQRLL